ncbi:MAG: hypothetical protein HY718_17430, partial [Planctomycetes bacterium]|nr:hypothetical protein [Planctomycetota bacterium]
MDDAKRTKAKEDCEAIGTSIARMLDDTHSKFLVLDGGGDAASRFVEDNRVDLAISTGDIPDVGTLVNDGFAGDNIFADVTWTDQLGVGPNVDSLYDQLVSNEPAYLSPVTPYETTDPEDLTRGELGHGWRGAYLSPFVGPDPWGMRYAVNSVFLGAAVDSDNDAEEGSIKHGWTADAFCLSAGPNTVIEADFSG